MRAKPHHAALATLRFLNMLEPGAAILSITKIAMWLSLVGLALHLFTGQPIDVASTTAFFTTSALYAWRRFVLWRTGSPPQEGMTLDPTSPIAG